MNTIIEAVYTREDFDGIDYWRACPVLKMTPRQVVVQRWPRARAIILNRQELETIGEVWHSCAGYVLNPPEGAIVGMEAAREEAERRRVERQAYEESPAGIAAEVARTERIAAYLGQSKILPIKNNT